MTDDRDDLERAQDLFGFLQGKMPVGMRLRDMPDLSPDVAWTVIYVLSEHFRGWVPPDHIERCDVCGDLYDTDAGGDCLDFGEAPYHFCYACEGGFDHHQKIRNAAECQNAQAQRDKRLRKRLLELADTTEQGGDGLDRAQLMARLRLIVDEEL